jgi:glycosyltransferase involved in cell wall biosynthesis
MTLTQAGTPIVDIVIPTRGRGALIDVTIASIRQSGLADFELWVVDQSADDTTQQATARHSRVDGRIHHLYASPRGSDFARNMGAAAGRAPYLVFTDDDCRVAPDWLGALTEVLADRSTWAVFGQVVPDDSYRPPDAQAITPVTPALPMAFKAGTETHVYDGRRFDLGFGHGANMGFRRERFEQVGAFDPLLGAGAPFRSWPERDIGYRILRRGGRIIYTPAALVYHRHWRGWEETRRTYRNYAFGAGAAVGKYVRCGDIAAIYLLVEWLFDQGLRQVFSGLFKWRSWQKVQVGLLQMVYPWQGLARSWRQPVDRERIKYVDAT